MIGEKIFCGLDVGARQIKASAIKFKHGKPELLAMTDARTCGFKNNSVSDLGEMSQSIHRLLSDLSKKAGVKFKDVQLGVGGGMVQARFGKAMIPLMDKASKVITSVDIKKVNKQARLLGIKLEEDILHDFPQYYVIDDANKVLNPSGLYGHKLAVASLLIVVISTAVANMIKAINQAGFEVGHVFFSSFAAAQAVLSKEALEGGCLLIDAGTSTTNLLFFKDGILRHLDMIAFGGNHLTESIANGLHLPMDLAEDIKKSHGVVLSDDVKINGEILIKKDDSYTAIKQRIVCESMEPEIARLIGTIRSALQFSHIQDKLMTGVVITGGASLLPGFMERLEKELGLQVSVGKSMIGMGASTNAAIFMGSIGLAQAGFSKSLGGGVLPINISQNWLGNLSHKIREMYEEYF